jgi:DNA-binding NarL/FixJ family response regulator
MSTHDGSGATSADEARIMTGGASGGRAGKVATIVIADDHEVARAGLRSVLMGERGLRVVGEACNGSEALALCRRLKPDVVLMDVRMPDIDGLAVTRAVRQESPSTSVILFTVYENPDYLLDALKAGAAGYLLKEASKDEILTSLRRVIGGESLLHHGLVLELLNRMDGERRSTRLRVRLTPREMEVIRLIASGLTNREIARSLGLTPSTAKTHVEHVIAKLGASDRTQAAVKAVEFGLVSLA